MKKKTITASILSLLAIGATAFAVVLSNTEAPKFKAAPRMEAATSTREYVDETLPLTDEDNLFISLSGATKTELGESFKVRFAANTVLYPVGTTGTKKYPQTNGVYVTPNDDAYPSDKVITELTRYDVDLATVTADDENVAKDEAGNAIVGEDGRYELMEGHDYSYKMPTFNAYVSRIDAYATRNKTDTVVIPYSITYGSWFNIRITEIGEDVMFNSARSYSEFYEGITTIILGTNIEKIPENAIKDAPAGLKIKTAYSERPEGWNEKFTNAQVEYAYTPTEDELAIYNPDPITYEDGVTVMYFDQFGAALDEEGRYLDENRNPIQVANADGESEYVLYDGEPLTKPKAYSFSAGAYKSQAADKTFIIGYKDSSKNINLPLLMEYSVVKADGSTEKRIHECAFDDEDETFEGVGAFAGKYSLFKDVDIELEEGESIDASKVAFYNVFEANIETNADGSILITPNLENAYRREPAVAYSNKNLLEDFFTISYKSLNTVFGYTSISLNVDLVDGAYEQVKEPTYKQYAKRIENGEIKIRYAFRGFETAYYQIQYADGTSEKLYIRDSVTGGLPGDLTYHIFKANKNNDLTFFFDNNLTQSKLDTSKITGVKLCSFRVSLDLCPTAQGTTQKVTKSDISFRFGAMNLLPKDVKSIGAFNGNVFLIVYTLVYVLAYVGLSFAYYMYAKNSFKNDEFRRINGKAYFKRMAKAFIGATLIAGAIAFIILRFGVINPSVILYNPMDLFVILFGVGGLISFGYFVKFFVMFVRQEKERRRIMKLKLDEDVADDGTK